MKKILTVLCIAAIAASCGSNNSDTNGSDSATINTTPASGNSDASLNQQIPRDSIETSSDSTGNIKPGDTTKDK